MIIFINLLFKVHKIQNEFFYLFEQCIKTKKIHCNDEQNNNTLKQ